LEPQTDDQGGLSHPGRVRETHCRSKVGWLGRLHARPDAGAGKALYLVELPRDGQLAQCRPRSQAGPCLDFGRACGPRLGDQDCQGLSRSQTSLRPRTGDGHDRTLIRSACAQRFLSGSRALFTSASSFDQACKRSVMLSRNVSAAPGLRSSILRNRLRGMRTTTVGSFAIAVAWQTVFVNNANSPTSVPGPTVTSLPSGKVPGSSSSEPS